MLSARSRTFSETSLICDIKNAGFCRISDKRLDIGDSEEPDASPLAFPMGIGASWPAASRGSAAECDPSDRMSNADLARSSENSSPTLSAKALFLADGMIRVDFKVEHNATAVAPASDGRWSARRSSSRRQYKETNSEDR